MKQIVSSLIFFVALSAHAAADKQYNVLLIMCDDLNDYVSGFGGHPQARTPAVEKLAASGTLFTKAYCNSPVCVPSRNSFITGIAPHNGTPLWVRWYNYPALKECKPMMAHFRDNGYYSVGTGKIDHWSHKEPYSKFYAPAKYGPTWWEEGAKEGEAHPDVPEPFRSIGQIDGSFGSIEEGIESAGRNGWRVSAGWGKPPNTLSKDKERGYMTPDKVNSYLAVDLLQGKKGELKGPFFLGVGFVRPHTPLHVEKKFFDQHPLEEVELPTIKAGDLEDTHLAGNFEDPKEVKGFKFYDYISKSYDGPEEGLKKFTQAYLASVSAVDENIERVLTALDESPYKDNTIVIMTSDHGWQMGEKDWLFKNSPWEESCRVPLVIRVPGLTKPGSRCDTPVSLIDIYPTLVDLCDLEGSTVLGENGVQLDGHSLRPLLENPEEGKWDGPEVAITCLPNPNNQKANYHPKNNHYSVRSKDFRYIRYANGKEELYDHRKDTHEWTNLADNPEYEEVKKKLFQQLQNNTGISF